MVEARDVDHPKSDGKDYRMTNPQRSSRPCFDRLENFGSDYLNSGNGVNMWTFVLGLRLYERSHMALSTYY